MSILLRRRQLAWLWFGAVLAPALAIAQQNPSLTLQSAVERSLAGNLELKASGYDLKVQEGRIEQAAARPSLEVGLAVENVLGSGTHRGVDAAETTLTLGWLLERGARERRINAAQAGLSVLQTEARLRQLDVAAETARRFLTVLAHQRELDELHKAAQLAEETHTTAQARVAAAKAPTAEAARAYAQLARVRLEEEHGEHELATAKLRLAAMWGEGGNATQSTVAIVRGDLLGLPPLREFSSLRAQLVNNPELSRLLTTQRLREAELQLADSRRRPAWQVSAGVRRFEATSDQALVVGLTVPLPNRAATQGALAQARAQSQQVQAQTQAVNVQLNVELFAIYQDMQHAYTEVAALRDEVLPRMEAAMEQSRYAYERGRYSYLEWVAAQRELTEIRRALLTAAANAHRYRIEIERLTGVAVEQRFNP
jgi:outer membrane protein, heavy metal efflux system